MLNLLTVLIVGAQAVAESQGSLPKPGGKDIPLNVPAGVPLRLYLTKRIPKRAGAPVEAKTIAPIFAFDHEVIPEGAQVLGHVSRLVPVPKSQRIRATLGGDFTPLHIAEVDFTTLILPDGRQMPLHVAESAGLNSLYSPQLKKKKTNANGEQPTGVIAKGKQAARDQIDAQMARVRSIPEIVRGPDKVDLFYDFALSKLPYHPQYVRNKTRFDAELQEPLSFGSETLPADSMALLGSQPVVGTIGHARLITPLDSGTTSKGQHIEAVLSEPLFTADHKLLLPEGTRVGGSVLLVRKARWLHRNGRLRFNFDSVDLPTEMAQLTGAAVPGFRTDASLHAAESGTAPFHVDREGGVQAEDSKTRLLSLAAAMIITHRAADNDSGHRDLNSSNSGGTNNRSNVAGRTLGGGLGFGLLGSIAAQSTPEVGTALGYYGLAWSLYDNLLARGPEVRFQKNAVIDISFNKRALAVSRTLQPTN